MIKLFEMFAGYGGASFALKKAGMPFECIGYSEIDKYAIQCFNQNFPNIKNFGDCTKINPKDLPDFDLLTGGFPCQDVSIAGKRDLTKGRTNLYKEILRIAEAKKPKYMLLENVKGLLSIEIDEVKLVNKIIRDLQKIGYGVCWKVLNSKDYGIPQNRERIWFVCKFGGWKFMEFQFPNPIPLKIFVKDILEKNVDEKYQLNKNQIQRLIENERHRNEMLQGGEPKEILIDSRKYKGEELLREYREGVSPTLMARARKDEAPIVMARSRFKYNELNDCSNVVVTLRGDKGKDILVLNTLTEAQGRQGSSSEFLDVICKIGRRLTPKECFRLMGFLNDEINLEGLSDTSKYKLAGNGWDINLVSKILKNMILKNGMDKQQQTDRKDRDA